MDETEKRAAIFGTGDEAMIHFYRIPRGTKLMKGNDGKCYPVADDDPRAIGETAYEVLEVVQPGELTR